jgi:Ricin-type beta-trefoil lectin domain-like
LDRNEKIPSVQEQDLIGARLFHQLEISGAVLRQLLRQELCRIEKFMSGKVLDVKGGPAAVANGVRIKLYQWLEGQNQIWYIENQPDGTYVIRSSSSSLVLDVQGGPDAQRNGDRIQQFPFQGTPNQKWRLIPLDPSKSESSYKIISVQSNKVLDAVGGMQATENGTELQQWDWNNTANQQWFIEPSHNFGVMDSLIDRFRTPSFRPMIKDLFLTVIVAKPREPDIQ